MEPVKLEGNEIDEVKTITYLGIIIDKHRGTGADVKARIGKARRSGATKGCHYTQRYASLTPM